jgi:hypothetical protein
VNQYNPLVLAITQESYNLDAHQSDLTQVKEDVNTVIVHLSPYAADIGRSNSANKPQGCSVSVRLFFNPQHWSAIPFSAIARYRHKMMDPLRKAVGIDSANPGECASITDWKIRGHSLCFFGNSSSVAEFENRRSCSIWICMASAIRK